LSHSFALAGSDGSGDVLHAESLKGFLIFLTAAGIIVPLFHRVRISPVLGFLILGAALGPHGLGRLTESAPWLWYVTFHDPDRGYVLAELGIIFLLFLLGLELSIGRLWQLRRYLFGVGLAQVALTTVSIGLLVRWLVAPPPAGVVLGLCLALSSTAVVMQILAEQHRTATPVGRISLAVLLFQDLMVVPILFIVGLLTSGGESKIMALVGPFAAALAAVPVLMAAGRFLIGPLLRSAARTGSRELILALALLIIIASAAATGAAGLSMALGAFLAGLLLSESEYRHHIEVDIEPFKGLLLGIFFITVGTSVDLQLVVAHAGPILAALIVLIVLKAAVLFAVARLFGIAKGPAIEIALLLAQAGEFAFVVMGLARSGNLLSPAVSTAVIAVVALSMIVTPVLAVLARKAGRQMAVLDSAAHAPGADHAEFSDHVVIGGFGRVGQTVARLIEAENVPYVALDANGLLVAEQRKTGRPVYFGDASRAEILERAGARNARAFVVTVDGPGAPEHMVEAIRSLKPGARIYVRARDAAHAAKLMALGAVAIPEAIEASLQLSGRVLEGLGLPEEAVMQRLTAARVNELKRFEGA
jgi:CPA2 family monovalent cation:H+ antiporter-2